MNTKFFFIFSILMFQFIEAQDLSIGYQANDLEQHPMQALTKPEYLSAVTDPSFPSTKIRRISEATDDDFIAPMYNSTQAWNADESLMIIYGGGTHKLLNGENYTFIRDLSDINPDDVETVFWDFEEPNVLFYIDKTTTELVSYNVNTMVKQVLVNLGLASRCDTGITGGNDVQMMSWNSDVISFRCGNTAAYYYRISTETLTRFNIENLEYVAPMPFPSGNLFYHKGDVYDASGNYTLSFNLNNGTEHSCIGKLSNGDDAYFTIGYEEGPNGSCQGTLVAHNAKTGYCFSVTPFNDYAYPKTGTHISALAHKNSEGGWVAVSCVGFQEDGVQLLDQEIFIAKVNEFDSDVYRVAHHRSDENDIDYWGEPHVTISPTGTRLLFGSDWSGDEDGKSVDSYVAELNGLSLSVNSLDNISLKVYPNPTTDRLHVESKEVLSKFQIFDIQGKIVFKALLDNSNIIDVSKLTSGMYFIELENEMGNKKSLKFIKQ